MADYTCRICNTEVLDAADLEDAEIRHNLYVGDGHELAPAEDSDVVVTFSAAEAAALVQLLAYEPAEDVNEGTPLGQALTRLLSAGAKAPE